MDINAQVARRLEELAQLLEEQGANVFRVHAYRRGAETVRRLERPVNEVLDQEGMEGLRRLPGVGDRIALAIRDVVRTGRLPMLDRLRGQTDVVELLRTVPGIGPVQAARLHEDLGIDSLEDLEAAAHDGRLADVAGLGAKRVAGIIDSLATRLGRIRSAHGPAVADATVAELLDVDREYRERAGAGELHQIAPRRFNPQHEAWLPILHTHRGERHYTVLFSNTARAHKLGKTADWVIVYYDGPSGERQCTVITSHAGALEGRRIVRGREPECAEYYGVDLSPMARGA
ncbi:MAG TPA: helix-hairpin-helix domain-containing protein [Bryobacteraceae bacterium]|nr:helix-hairpin-helix domain-containing protein [Bryobacteraceae bacterium]